MTILVAVKKNGRIWMGADRITTFGSEYTTDLVNASKIIKLKHAYLATSGYTLLDNIIEHLYEHNHKMMESEFKNRAQVFQFFLEMFNEMKKTYTLVDTGKETYAGIYNVFLLVTPTSIYGISNNLSVHEYDRYAAKGAGSDYSQGTLYALYELIDNGLELTRVALEAACHFSIYCKEPIDILEVKASDFGQRDPGGYKSTGSNLSTIPNRVGMANFSLVQKEKLLSRLSSVVKTGTNGTKIKAQSSTKKPTSKATASKTAASKKTASKTSQGKTKTSARKTSAKKSGGSKAAVSKKSVSKTAKRSR